MVVVMPTLREAKEGALEYEAMWDSGEQVKRKKKPHKYDIDIINPGDDTEFKMMSRDKPISPNEWKRRRLDI